MRKKRRKERFNSEKIILLFYIIFQLPVGAGKEGDGLNWESEKHSIALRKLQKKSVQ